MFNRGSYSAMKTKDKGQLSAVAMPDRVQGLRAFNNGSSSQHLDKVGGIQGLGSGGIRLAGTRLQN
jgi:hypothetical protein